MGLCIVSILVHLSFLALLFSTTHTWGINLESFINILCATLAAHLFPITSHSLSLRKTQSTKPMHFFRLHSCFFPKSSRDLLLVSIVPVNNFWWARSHSLQHVFLIFELLSSLHTLVIWKFYFVFLCFLYHIVFMFVVRIFDGI